MLTPGDSSTTTGKLTVADTYTQSSSGALDIQINGATAGTKYDLLKVTQGATLGGTLNIALGTGFTPTVGETFTILTASSVSDTFATVNGLAINGSEHFTITYNAGQRGADGSERGASGFQPGFQQHAVATDSSGAEPPLGPFHAEPSGSDSGFCPEWTLCPGGVRTEPGSASGDRKVRRPASRHVTPGASFNAGFASSSSNWNARIPCYGSGRLIPGPG